MCTHTRVVSVHTCAVCGGRGGRLTGIGGCRGCLTVSEPQCPGPATCTLNGQGEASPPSPQTPRGAAPGRPVGFRDQSGPLRGGCTGLPRPLFTDGKQGLLGPQTDWWEREASPASPPWTDPTWGLAHTPTRHGTRGLGWGANTGCHGPGACSHSVLGGLKSRSGGSVGESLPASQT